jgi:ABC-type branched-subunit amino acid transport system substrate-binding protein
VHARRIELAVEDDAQGDAQERLLRRGAFALVASLRTSRHASDAALARDGLALVGPIGTPPGGDEPQNVFYVFPGARVLARTVVQHLALAPRPPRLAIVAAQGGTNDEWVAGASAEAERRGIAAAVRRFAPGAPDARALVREVRAGHADAVLFAASPGDLAAFVAAQQAAGDRTRVYAPAELAGAAAIPPAAVARVLYAWTALTTEELAESARAFRAFAARHALAPTAPTLQLHAYASAALLVEALRRAGARPTRRGLVAALESVSDFETGVAPPLTFGAGRHTGVLGAWLVTMHPERRRAEKKSGWIALSP